MIHPVYLRVCTALKRARIEAGWSPDELAKQIHQTPTFIEEYERGRHILLMDELLRVTHALHVDPASLLARKVAEDGDGHVP